MTQWRAQLLWSKQNAGGQLNRFLEELGLTGSNYSALGLKLNGQRVMLRLDFTDVRPLVNDDDDGLLTVRSRRERRLTAVMVTAKFERSAEQGSRKDDEAEQPDSAPSIELRRETQSDREDKSSGLTKEIQTGFSGFDHAVFVDNDSSEADARRILSKEATRQAVLRLLDGTVGDARRDKKRHHTVTITTTGVSVKHQVENEYIETNALLEAIEDLLIVARAGGPKDERPARRGENLEVLSIAFAALAGAYCFWVLFTYKTFLPLLLGGVVGGGAGFFTRPMVERLVSGDSGSGRRAYTMVLAMMAGVGALLAGLIAHANVLLDDSKPEARRGYITRVWQKTGKSSGEYVDVRFDDGSDSSFRSPGNVHKGQQYVEWHRAGALGFEWISSSEVRR